MARTFGFSFMECLKGKRSLLRFLIAKPLWKGLRQKASTGTATEGKRFFEGWWVRQNVVTPVKTGVQIFDFFCDAIKFYELVTTWDLLQTGASTGSARTEYQYVIASVVRHANRHSGESRNPKGWMPDENIRA